MESTVKNSCEDIGKTIGDPLQYKCMRFGRGYASAGDGTRFSNAYHH